MKDVLRNNWFR